MKEPRMSATLIRDAQFESITKQNKLMKLAENMKKKKKTLSNAAANKARRTSLANKKSLKLDPGYTNSIEHLVYGVYRSKSASNPATPEKGAESERTEAVTPNATIDGAGSPASRTNEDPSVQGAWTDGQEHQTWFEAPPANIYDDLGVSLCPVPSVCFLDDRDRSKSDDCPQYPDCFFKTDGATIFANMPALRNTVGGINGQFKKSFADGRSTLTTAAVPVIKNLSLAQVSSLKIRRSTGMVDNDRIVKSVPRSSKLAPTGDRNSSQRLGTCNSESVLRSSTRSGLPVPKHSLASQRSAKGQCAQSGANHRSSSCDGRRNCSVSSTRTWSGSSDRSFGSRWQQHHNSPSCGSVGVSRQNRANLSANASPIPRQIKVCYHSLILLIDQVWQWVVITQRLNISNY